MSARNIRMVALATSLILALAIPAVAVAAPFTKLTPGSAVSAAGAPRLGTAAANQAAKLSFLKQRITLVLEGRRIRFDFAAQRVNFSITRIGQIAGKVQTAGGDVTAVRAKLDAAKSSLASAKASEVQAIALFRAVPSATDKKAAWAAARAQGKVAGGQLKDARTAAHEAGQLLRQVIQSLKAAKGAAGSTGTGL